MSYNEIVFFSLFIFFILGMLSLDLGVFSKKNRVISFKEAGIWSGVWVMFTLIFYVIIQTHGDSIHGVQNFEDIERIKNRYAEHVQLIPGNYEASLQAYRDNMALEFITGYLIEYALSVDNIFVIILIFTSFGVKEKYYKKVLFWGIMGAIVMRFIFIFAGSALMHRFSWIIYIFGAFLLYTGIKMFFDKGGDEKIEPNNHPVVKFVSKRFRVYHRYVNDRFWVKLDGKWSMTPLFVVLIIIEFTDLIFAVDSVPAVFSITKDPFVVFFSNIFAILGLRSMFFFLSNIMHIFHYLKTGLAFLLVFIGVKMIAHSWLHNIGFKISHSLYVILGILAVSVIASLAFPKKKAEQIPIL
jgi:tellurite resistance protein TerC